MLPTLLVAVACGGTEPPSPAPAPAAAAAAEPGARPLGAPTAAELPASAWPPGAERAARAGSDPTAPPGRSERRPAQLAVESFEPNAQPPLQVAPAPPALQPAKPRAPGVAQVHIEDI
ncbi:MAG: hypothetical protein ACK57B_06490 [Betaproteobacteria bacterium]